MNDEVKIYKKYHPNGVLSDSEITSQLASFHKYFPKENLEQFLSKRKNLWDAFKRKYPKANISKFREVEDEKGKVGIYFNAWKILDENGVSDNFDDFSNPEMKKELMLALGPRNDWPIAFTPTTDKYKVPANNFNDKNEDLSDVPTDIEIYVSQNSHFLAKFRKLGGYGTIHFTSAKQSHAWLNEPIFGYWSQQLNFAVWCAT